MSNQRLSTNYPSCQYFCIVTTANRQIPLIKSLHKQVLKNRFLLLLASEVEGHSHINRKISLHGVRDGNARAIGRLEIAWTLGEINQYSTASGRKTRTGRALIMPYCSPGANSYMFLVGIKNQITTREEKRQERKNREHSKTRQATSTKQPCITLISFFSVVNAFRRVASARSPTNVNE